MKSAKLFLHQMNFAMMLMLPVAGFAGDNQAHESKPVITHPEGRVEASDLAAAQPGLRPEHRAAVQETEGAAEALAKDLLIRRLVAERARTSGMLNDPVLARRLKLAEEKALFDLSMEMAEAKATDEKLLERLAKTEYSAYPEKYRRESRRARHLLVRESRACPTSAESVAKDLLARLKNGESFETLASQYSDDAPSASKGGDLGWLEKGKTVPEFETALFSLKKAGDVSDIVKSQFGYHIIELLETRPTETIPFDEVRSSLIESIRTRAKNEARAAIVLPIVSSPALSIDMENLRKAVGLNSR